MKNLFKGLIICLTLFLISNVKAGNLSLSVSTTSVIVGNNVVVTIKDTDLAGKFSLTSSNGSVLSGGASSIWMDSGDSKTYTFKANSAGTAVISVNPIDVADYNGNVYSSVKSITVTVKNKPVIILSGDSSLSNISVSNYTLEPVFDKGIYEYTVNLPPETTTVDLQASASHSGASISGIGTREVTDGDNRLEIVVTAENGTSSTYYVNAKVEEYNPVKVNIDGNEYTVVRKKSQIIPPENYNETVLKINEEEIPAYKSDITGYTLICLKDMNGNQEFYIYENDNYILYKELTFNQIKLQILKMENVPKNYNKGVFVYNDENIDAYKINANSNYSLIYAMNVQTGEKNYYMYDSRENTVQIYNEEEINILNNKIDMMIYLVIGLLGLSFMFLVIITILIIKKSNKKNKESNNKKIEML